MYSEDSSLGKFIARNWKLPGALTERSRDNLPNPVQHDTNLYVPEICPRLATCSTCFTSPESQERGRVRPM